MGTAQVLPTTAVPTKVAIGNVAGDAANDAVVGTTAGVNVFPQVSGAFGSRTTLAAGHVTALALRDLDADGRTDLVVGTTVSGTYFLSVFLNVGDGFQGTAGYSTTIASPSAGIESGDFDGDGRVDLAVMTGVSVSLFRNQGNGTFTSQGTFSQPTGGFVVVDQDNDGRDDLLSITANGLYVARGNGSFTFEAPLRLFGVGRLPATAQPAIASAKVDLDTFRDLILLAPLSTGSEVVTLFGTCR
ncbi:MAG: VCBS repeat-containing protein [Myxococcota bacterium]